MLDLKNIHDLELVESLFRYDGIDFLWISRMPSSDQLYISYLSNLSEDMLHDTVVYAPITPEQRLGLVEGRIPLWDLLDQPLARFDVVHSDNVCEVRGVEYLDSVRNLPEDQRPKEGETLDLMG